MQKFLIQLTLIAFIGTSLGLPSSAQAQTLLNLPAIGTMINFSPAYKPLQIKGIKVYRNNPLHFDFLVDKGDSHLFGQVLKDEITRLSKYFLTCLTVPETDLWVNLSPYEKNRIAPENFGVTQMGKDLLEQDYLLKQIVASLTYPEHPLGKAFWQKVYKRAYELYGTTEVTVNTFNKVWIVPQTGEVFVNGNNAFVVKSQLGVMLDTDYLALKFQSHQGQQRNHSEAYTQIFREMILPELKKEINANKNFAVVRQIYDAMILATWYKKHLKDGLLGKSYVGKNKVKGVDVDDKTVKERIFAQYVQSFAKRVYNYVREDYDPFTQKTIPRKYTSGGFDGTNAAMIYKESRDSSKLSLGNDLAMASISLLQENGKGQIVSFPDPSMGQFDSKIRNSAMASFLRKFFRILGVAVLVSIAGVAGFGGSAHGATYQQQDNGDMSVDVDSRDTLGHIFAKMPIHGDYFKDLKQQKLWGEHGAISQLDVHRDGSPVLKKDLIYKGERLVIKAPQKVGTVPPVIQVETTSSPTGTIIVESTLTAGEQAVRPLVVDRDLTSSVTRGDAGTGIDAPQASLKGEQPLTTAVSSNDRINGDSNGLIMVAIAGVTLALGRMLFWTRNKINLGNSKTGSSAPPPHKPGPVPIAGSVNHETAPAFQAASAQEQSSLASSLSAMQRAEQDGLHLQSSQMPIADNPIPSSLPPRSSFWSKLFSFQSFYLLGVVGAGIFGFDAFSSGGYLYALGTFASTAFLATVHEFQHMFVAGKTTGKWSQAFSNRNILKAFNILNPGVYLPMAREGKINTKVRWAGFGGTLVVGGLLLGAMGGLAGVTLLSPLMLSTAIATAVVGTSSFISDILFKKRTQETGNFFCGISGLLKPVNYGGVKLIQDNNDVTVAVITPDQFLKKIDMPDGQDVLNWMERWGRANNAWQWGKDREKAYLAVNDNLKDDLQKHLSKEKFDKVWALLKPKSLFTSIQWLLRILAESLSDRGAQQKGAGIFLQGKYILEKLLKLKRAILRPAWYKGGPVFWRSLDQEFANQFESVLPAIMHPANDFGGPNVISIYQHNRFATQGELVDDAAHPHLSKGLLERVFGFDPAGALKKIVIQVVFFFSENGDNNGVDINGIKFGFFEMRRFFASIQHKLYEGEVTKQYLKKTVIVSETDRNDLKEYGGVVFDFTHLLKELTRFGYIRNGQVNPQFYGFSEEFVQQLNNHYPFKVISSDGTFENFKFSQGTIHSIESSLWAMPPGDAPIGALELDFFRAQGRPLVAVKKAFYLNSGFKNVEDLMKNINTQKDEQHAGAVFEQVLDVVLPFLSRPELISTQEWQKTLKDLWVEDDLEAAKKMGLQEQLLMLRILKKMLYDRITKEIEDQTEAGGVYSRWMEVWREQNPTSNDRDNLRNFIEAATKNFFTADLQAAVEEFAVRSLGNGSSFGTSYATNIESRTVLYNNFQDVLVGYSEKGLVGFASDPRVLKAKDADGDKLDYVMQFKQQGEIATIDYTHSGIIFKEMFANDASWDSFVAQMKQAGWGEELSPRAMRMTVLLDIVIAEGSRVFGQDNFDSIFAIIERALTQRANIKTVQLQKDNTWEPTAAAELKERFYPTAEYVNGKKNPYYVGGPVEYKDYTNITGQDLQDAQQIMAQAQEAQADPQSFNRRTSSNLAKEINDIFEREGEVRVLQIGYGNSDEIPRHSEKLVGKLIPSKNVIFQSVHANLFDKNPQKYLPKGDKKTIVIFYSKSGATFATKLAAYVTTHMISMKRIFCVTGRPDSVLTNVLGQSLQPDAPFSERFFFTGDFYPSEAPVVSEMLLMYQQMRMAFQLAIDLKALNPSNWSAGYSRDKITEMMNLFETKTTQQMQELAQGKWNKLGQKMGHTLKEWFNVKWATVFYTASLFIKGGPIMILTTFLTGGASWVFYPAVVASFVSVIAFPFLYKMFNSWLISRPQFSKLGSPNIGILSEEDVVHETTKDMMIRLFSLGFGSLSPKGFYSGNSVTQFLHKYSGIFGRGDILMLFRSAHKTKGGSQFNQAGFPNTGAFGEGLFKSRPEKIEVVVEVPQMTKTNDDGDEIEDIEAQEIMDDTVGAMGQMIAAKGIWVTASRMASFNGRMWNDAHTFNRAGVHSTESGEDANANIMNILDNPYHANDNIDPETIKASAAMVTVRELRKKGGIDMNSRLLDLKVHEDHGMPEVRLEDMDKAMLTQPIEGLIPQIKSITIVTQPMLQKMLSETNLN